MRQNLRKNVQVCYLHLKCALQLIPHKNNKYQKSTHLVMTSLHAIIILHE